MRWFRRWRELVPATPGLVILILLLGIGCGDDNDNEADPMCEVNPDTLSFEPVPVGSDADLTFTLRNGGGKKLEGMVTSNSEYFVVEPESVQYSLGKGESRTYRVRFTPTENGPEVCEVWTGTPNGSCLVRCFARGLGDTTRPAPVVDLQVLGTAETSVNLGWTSVGDDSLSGRATQYDVRYSLAAITEATWAEASQALDEPAPKPPAQIETFSVTGLQGSTHYYFALKTSDDEGHWSALSAVAEGTTRDNTPPGEVSDFEATFSTATTITFHWTAVGDDGLVGRAGSYDIRYSTTETGPWATATQVSGEPDPLPAGEAETFTVENLVSDTQYYFWIAAGDDELNWSVPAGPLAMRTRDVAAPATVNNLEVESTTANSMTLVWTAPGDDGTTGQAAAYEMRFSTGSGGLWEVMEETDGEPAPSASGERETFTVTGLQPNTTYYFRIRTVDESSNWSVPSNEAEGRHDTLPPAAVDDLESSAVSGSTVALTWTAPGDDGHEGMASLYDLRYSTDAGASWEEMTQAVGEPEPSLFNPQTFTLTGLSPDRTYYLLLRSADEVPNWSASSNLLTVHTGDMIPPDAINDLAISSTTGSDVTLTWTSTGDDGLLGTASWYDIRYSTNSGVAWESMTQATSEPAPRAPGQTETFTVPGLRPNTMYYFRMKIGDEGINWSPGSNVASGATLDTVAPSDVTTLSAVSSTGISVTLNWTSVGDDLDEGRAQTYDVRYATSSGTAWEGMTEATGEPAPKIANQSETFTVTGLVSGTTYYFLMKVADEVPNWSAVSNSASRATLDILAPAAVTDLAAAPASTGSGITLTWTAPGDDGATGTAAQYDVRYSTNSGALWADMTPAIGEPTPRAAGLGETFTIGSLVPSHTYYVRLKTRDEAENWSVESNEAGAAPDNVRPAAVTDLVTASATTTSLTLRWTASGDDSLSGTATSYDIRRSASAINSEAQFAAATPVAYAGTPHAPGQPDSVVVTALPLDSSFFFRLKVRDDAGNLSALSNLATGTTLDTADVRPPAAVTDLAAGASTDDRVLLTWTATGDDSLSGRAASYVIRYATAAEANWEAMLDISGEPTPATSGTFERFAVEGLNPSITYYFRIRVRDERPNTSGESNEAGRATAPSGMAFIPDGSVRMGQTFVPFAEPVHTAEVSAFFIDLKEVTTEDYQAFILDDGYTTEANWNPVGWEWVIDQKINAPAGWYTGGVQPDDRYLHNNPNLYPTFPVQGVSWWEADAYARWAGKRLPTEVEWEMAAKGGCEMWGDPEDCDSADTPTYPWGEGDPTGRANYSGSGDPYDDSGRTTPAGYYDGTSQGGYQTTDSPSPYGCYDNAGNLWEWCLSRYDIYPYNPNDGREDPPATPHEDYRVLRGGSWYYETEYMRCATRDKDMPDQRDIGVGFRCAQD